MGGFFGAVTRSSESCVFDVFYGTDYHSHLGTRRAGMVMYDTEKGFDRSIHNIENSPFRTKFDSDVSQMTGFMGIGCISDYEAQPLLLRSKLGTYAITKSELAGVIVSVVFVVIYYIILKTQNKKIEQNFQFFVKRMENCNS